MRATDKKIEWNLENICSAQVKSYAGAWRALKQEIDDISLSVSKRDWCANWKPMYLHEMKIKVARDELQSFVLVPGLGNRGD